MKTLAKYCSKFSRIGFNSTWTENFQIFKLDLEKVEESDIHCIIEKAKEFQKNICFIDYTKAFDMWITTNCRKFLKRWEYQTTFLTSWETCMRVNKQQLELNMEQWTGSKLEKEYVKAVYCHPAYLTYMQSVSCKMPGWMKQAEIKIARRNINNVIYAEQYQ